MIDDLLVKYLAGETNSSEDRSIAEWRKKSEGNEQYFQQFKKIWEDSETAALHTSRDENAAWERFKENVINRTEDKQTVKLRRLPLWFRAAAIITVLAAGGIIAAYIYRNVVEVTMTNVQAGVKPLSDTLPDGSIVTLNRNSKLIYPSRFTGGSRIVRMEGEGFFEVTPDKSKPFKINVNNVTVTVVGTSFNIRSRQGKTEVIVKTGIVRVAKNNDLVELKAGEKVTAESEGRLVKEQNKSTLYNAYQTNTFVCRNTALLELIGALNNTYGADIRIADKSLENLKINNTFSNDSLESILTVISETFSINVERSGQKIILSK
ncbi:FecR family protein [Arcticibacter sp. MXS-1]|uniref:FecR family protein n=1 Tax=Arcticibacter sp. MXS-1 TaxID=3341726 RepID=UPI0035A946A7